MLTVNKNSLINTNAFTTALVTIHWCSSPCQHMFAWSTAYSHHFYRCTASH